MTQALAHPEMAAERKHAADDHAIPSVRAAFVMAPALIQALDPDSLSRLHVPVLIALGDADTVAPPATNGLVAARMVPGAALQQRPGVGHYDFLSACTEAGQAILALCRADVPQKATHGQAIAAANAFLDRALGS